jgi:hypothetical protein
VGFYFCILCQLGVAQVVVRKVVTLPIQVQIPLCDMFTFSKPIVNKLYMPYSCIVNLTLCLEESRV